jgi:hypothetical protein
MDNMAQDGELNSKVFPLADTSRRDYPIADPVDCTWEMLADRGHMVINIDKAYMSNLTMLTHLLTAYCCRNGSDVKITDIYRWVLVGILILRK